MTDLDVLVEQAHNRIRNALLECENPTIAFSGGKDSLVVAHLMAQHGVTDGACELSFYYQRQEDSIREQAARSGFNITFYRRLDDDWLRRRNHIIFTSDTAARAASFAARQQKTVAIHAKKNRHDLIAFGRRTEENSVPRHLYKNKAGWSFHPIRDYIAFYPGPMDGCFVDGERVVSQPGDFYGGWITSDLVGPFKGGAGTRGW